jgi:hypothetical protein
MTPKRGGPFPILGYSTSDCGGKIGIGTGFSPNQSMSLLSIIPLTFHAYIKSNTPFKRTRGRSLETVKQSNTISHIGEHWKGK